MNEKYRQPISFDSFYFINLARVIYVYVALYLKFRKLSIRVLEEKNGTGFFRFCDNITDNYADKHTYI